MDSRSAAHVLNQIGSLLKLTGAEGFKAKAYQRASRAILELGTDDLTPLLESGALAATPGVGPATLAVVRDLLETGTSRYLEELQADVPPGLIEMARVPGLGLAKVSLIHQELNLSSLDELEEAARDGRLAALPRFGPKTAQHVLEGIAFARDAGGRVLYHRGLAHAVVLREMVAKHPGVTSAFIAGDVHRHLETIGEIDIAAICTGEPAGIFHAFARAPSVTKSVRNGHQLSLEFVDGTRLSLWCSSAENTGFVSWLATGSVEHLAQVTSYADARGYSIDETALRRSDGTIVNLACEADFFDALALSNIPPELREGMGEVEASANDSLPDLITSEDIKGVLHCHSTYSDGATSIAELAAAARALGWSYLGISDHSEAAYYAGGMSRADIVKQHDEIDELNSRSRGLRILKGIECDILPSGELDYGDRTLDKFDYVIGSIHSQFRMSRSAMTKRVLSAMDDPRFTILGHPTGRLLLRRDGYSLDIDAIIDKAAETGVAIELNCNPNRMDLDWRDCREARDRGVSIEIGPDAHSIAELDNVEMGVGMARKAWLSSSHVLNAQSADHVLKRGRQRRKS
ncbi:MAG: PHP domain-containing protein [Gemmatimonadaceae bacterium]